MAGKHLGFAKGQSGLEFLYSAFLSLAFFAVVLAVFYQSQADAASLAASAQARRICTALALQIGKAAAAGEGASSPLVIPAFDQNYTLFVVAPNRSISVSYQGGGAGCSITTSNVSNGTAYMFVVGNASTLRNYGGGVVFE